MLLKSVPHTSHTKQAHVGLVLCARTAVIVTKCPCWKYVERLIKSRNGQPIIRHVMEKL